MRELLGLCMSTLLIAILIGLAVLLRSHMRDADTRTAELHAATPADASLPIPATLEECFPALDRMLSPEVREKLRSGETAPAALHFGLGMWIRNNWGLWKGSALSRSLPDAHPATESARIPAGRPLGRRVSDTSPTGRLGGPFGRGVARPHARVTHRPVSYSCALTTMQWPLTHAAATHGGNSGMHPGHP